MLVDILAERIHDGRFLRLIGALLQAGYLENWRFNATFSGVPQGSIVSPVLANLYLDRLDQWVETTLLPQHNRGRRRRPHPEYERLLHRAKYLARTGRRQLARPLRRQAQRLPSVDPADPDYRRLRYVRYADDVLLGFNGPRVEAEAIKQQIGTFLREQLRLELAEPKTLLTHARTGAAHFLGYEITVLANDAARDQHGRRSINGQIGLKVPAAVIRAKCRAYVRHGKPRAWAEHLHDDPFSILVQFQQTFRGVANYYRLAYNLHRLDWLRYTMERSLVRTLGKKLSLSNPQVYRRFGAALHTPDGPRKGLEVQVKRAGKSPLVAQWGGVSLRWRIDAILDDRPPHAWNARTEVLERLLADTCELCGSHDHVQVHHVRHLKDLQKHRGKPVPAWVQKMDRAPPKDPGCLPQLPRCYPRGSPRRSARRGLKHWRAGCSENVAGPVRREAVGKGSPTRDLAGGPPSRNVVDALDQLQRQRRAAGSAAFGHGVCAPPIATPNPPPPPDPTPESKPGARPRSFRAGPDQWERARALRGQGWSIQAIGRAISLSPKTVRRHSAPQVRHAECRETRVDCGGAERPSVFLRVGGTIPHAAVHGRANIS